MIRSGVSLACCESEHASCTYAGCECGCHQGPKPHALELEIESRVMEFDLDNPGKFRIYREGGLMADDYEYRLAKERMMPANCPRSKRPRFKGDPFCHVCGGEGEVTTDGANVVKCPRCGEGI